MLNCTQLLLTKLSNPNISSLSSAILLLLKSQQNSQALPPTHHHLHRQEPSLSISNIPIMLTYFMGLLQNLYMDTQFILFIVTVIHLSMLCGSTSQCSTQTHTNQLLEGELCSSLLTTLIHAAEP